MTERPDAFLTRRGFLVASAAAGITAAQAPAVARAPIGVGLAGCGGAGRSIGRALASRTTALRLASVLDADGTRAHKCADVTGARAERDWRSMLARPHLEAIIIATPDGLHAEMAAEALAAGKHVYLCPPIARTANEVRTLQKCAQKSGRVLHVGMDAGRAELWRDARLRLDSRAGAPRWIHVDCPRVAVGAGHWSRDRAQSLGVAAREVFGALYPLQHHLGLGAPGSATAVGGAFEAGTGGVPDALAVTVRYGSGLTVVLEYAAGSRPQPVATIRGPWTPLELPIAVGPGSGMPGDLAQFARAITEDEAAATSRIDDACTAQAALWDAVEHC